MKYYLKKFWKPAAAAAVLMILAYGLQVYTSLLQIQIMQSLLDGDLKMFLLKIVLSLAVWLVIVLCLIGETVFQGRTVRQINNALRRDMAVGLLRKTHQEYHKLESGEYLSQFTNDVNQINQLAWTPFFVLIGAAAQVACGIAALASIHWLLLAASLVIAVIMIFVPRLFNQQLGQVGAECSANQSDGISKIKDLLAGYDVLRYGRIPLAAFMGTGNICAGVYNGLNQISKLSVSFAASRPYFAKITCHAEDRQAEGKTLRPFAHAISVEDLSFCYGEKSILENVSFRFEKGKKYALTGPSGCGKSTLLKLLLGWLPDYTGHISLDETDIRTVAPEQLQQQMSYIEQNVFLFNTTIRENITLGEDFPEEQLQKAVQDSALAGDLAWMPDGLDTVVGEEGCNVSGGQKQRIAIARALIHKRSILLVDEGTSALDAKNADLVEKSLLANPDLTLILISHHLTPERKAQFDRVYEMEAAR